MAYSGGYSEGYGGVGASGSWDNTWGDQWGPLAAEPLHQFMVVPWDELEATIYSLEPGRDYEVAVAAFDHAGRSAGFSSPVVVSTASDTTAPGTPAPFSLTAGVLEITATHTLGLQAGGTYNLANDLAEIEVHMSLSSGFTPDASTKVAALKADNSNLVTQRPVSVTIPLSDSATRYFKAIAVDRTGNQSDPSGQTSAIPSLISSTQIIDRTIQSLDIDLEAITEELIASRSIFTHHLYVADFDNLIFNPGAEAGTTLTPHAAHDSSPGGGIWSIDSTLYRSGEKAFKYDPTGQTGKARLVLNVPDGDAASNPDSLISMSPGRWLASSLFNACELTAVANDAGIAFVWYDKDLAVLSEVEQLNTAVGVNYATVSLMAQAPANTAFASIELRVANESNNNSILFDDILVRRALEGNLIVDGSIEGNHLSSVTIEVAKHIQSTNYSPGTSGWQIPGDDTIPAEFNNVTVRGEVIAESGELQDLDVTGVLSLDGSGKIRTTALPSGQRVEIAAADSDRIVFYGGGTNEATNAHITSDANAGSGIGLRIDGGTDTTDFNAINYIKMSTKGYSGAYGLLAYSAEQILGLRVGTDSSIEIGDSQTGGTDWLRLVKSGSWFKSPDAVATDTIFDIDSDGPIFTIVKRADGRGDIEFHGDILGDASGLPNDASTYLNNLTTVSAGTWTGNQMSPTLDYTHVEDKEVSVMAWGNVHASQTTGSSTQVRARLQISLDDGGSWTTSNTAGRHQKTLATGERVSLYTHLHVAGTMTGDIRVQMQVYSQSADTDFLSGHLMRTVRGTT